MNSEYALTADLFSQCNFNPRKQLHYDWRANFDPVARVCSVNMRFERHNGNAKPKCLPNCTANAPTRAMKSKQCSPSPAGSCCTKWTPTL
jgi:hypothetical protein